MKNSIYTLTLLIVCACTSEKEAPAENQLIGTWQNVTLDVFMSIDGIDSALIIKEGEWENVLGIQPIKTKYNSDSTFMSKYYTLDGQLFHTSVGQWWIRNDSLVMVSEAGEDTYAFETSNDKAEFRSKMDWNQDGTLDKYQGTQIRVQ